MPGSPPFLIPSAAGLFVLAVAAGFALARAAHRRERSRGREERAGFRAALRRLLRGAMGPAALRERAESLAAESFWAALETLPARLPRPVRLRLAAALGESAHARDERRALRDDSPWRRELAARRLGRLPTPRTRLALRRAMRRGPEPVTFAAARSLARDRDAATLAWLLTHPEALARRTLRARVSVLRGFGPGALPRLARALEDAGDPGLRCAIVETLGLGGHGPAIPAIEIALGDPEPEVRVAAARALGRLGAPASAGALMSALRDAAWPVRAQAAWALGHVRAQDAVRPLAVRLTDPAWWVRRHAAYALGELGEEGRRALREVADESGDRYAREMALEVLGGGFRDMDERRAG